MTGINKHKLELDFFSSKSKVAAKHLNGELQTLQSMFELLIGFDIQNKEI